MCEAHLIERARLARTDLLCRCAYCGRRIRGAGIEVSGVLDDGSLGTYFFAYHEDCLWEAEHDSEVIESNNGCFSYGEPFRVDDSAGTNV